MIGRCHFGSCAYQAFNALSAVFRERLFFLGQRAFSGFSVQRLKTRPQFQAVLAGQIVAKTEHFALHRSEINPGKSVAVVESPLSVADGTQDSRLFPLADIWLGAMAPKRWAKRAVTRNAIKRQIYSVSTDFLNQLPQAAFVVRLRREFSRREFVSAYSEQLKQAVRVEVVNLLRAATTAL